MQLDHEYMGQCLADVGVDVGASGGHGLLCGLICAGEMDIHRRLHSEWYSSRPEGDYAVEECQRVVDELVHGVRSSLDGMDFEFPLLLPSEDTPLQERASAVRDWCEGFLYGVGLADIESEEEMSDQVREALNDLAEISRMDVGSIIGDEDEEVALTEVAEFVRISAMLVHDELSESGQKREKE